MGKEKYSVLKMWGQVLDISSDVTVISGNREDHHCDLAIILGVCGESGGRFLT